MGLTDRACVCVCDRASNSHLFVFYNGLALGLSPCRHLPGGGGEGRRRRKRRKRKRRKRMNWRCSGCVQLTPALTRSAHSRLQATLEANGMEVSVMAVSDMKDGKPWMMCRCVRICIRICFGSVSLSVSVSVSVSVSAPS